jgi:hypothetical protein
MNTVKHKEMCVKSLIHISDKTKIHIQSGHVKACLETNEYMTWSEFIKKTPVVLLIHLPHFFEYKIIYILNC